MSSSLRHLEWLGAHGNVSQWHRKCKRLKYFNLQTCRSIMDGALRNHSLFLKMRNGASTGNQIFLFFIRRKLLKYVTHVYKKCVHDSTLFTSIEVLIRLLNIQSNEIMLHLARPAKFYCPYSPFVGQIFPFPHRASVSPRTQLCSHCIRIPHKRQTQISIRYIKFAYDRTNV